MLRDRPITARLVLTLPLIDDTALATSEPDESIARAPYAESDDEPTPGRRAVSRCRRTG